MSPGEKFMSGRPFLSVVGGTFAQKATKDTPDAKLREYEFKDGTKGSKWEINFLNWSGVIQSIVFKATPYGDMCNIEFDDVIVSLNTESRYFTDFAQKIKNADLSKSIKLHPYDFEGDNGKKVKGISMEQNGEKLKNYYYDFDNKKAINGFPEVDQEKAAEKKTYWKGYFLSVADFLVGEMEKLEFPESKPATMEEATDIFAGTGPNTDTPF